jgi:hypothetical protein
VDESTDLGRTQAAWIRARSARSFTEARTEAGLTAFTFPPEQRCFAADEHRVQLERPALYVVRGGDWRAHLGNIRRHRSAEDWRDDFGEHQQRLAEAQQRG